jgi:hypothetical protein
MRRRFLLGGLLAAPGLMLSGPARAQRPRTPPPHAWVFGSWTGGQFPPGDGTGPECVGAPTVIFTRDLVMRATALDLTLRQRVIETVALTANGLEFRFTPLAPGRIPPDFGFGCASNPNLLRVERRGPDEIIFPGCSEFPSLLRRCK